MGESSLERLMKDIRRVLESPFWIPELNAREAYMRVHDDHDGTYEGRLIVYFGEDGDAWVAIDGSKSLRFRGPIIRGGCSPRVRNALMILALAIKFDNEEHPQEIPKADQKSE